MKRITSKKANVLCLIIIAASVLLISGCVTKQPAIKYQLNESAAPGQMIKWTFDTDPVGGLPKGANVFSGDWIIRTDSDAPTPPNALCQIGVSEFPALSLSDTVYVDAAVSSFFKPISGHTDQAAGIIFRIQDKDNYYILRVNALEDNINLYKYVAGRRSLIKGVSVNVESGKWQELRVENTGNRIQGFLNGQMVVEATDDTFSAGRVGIWTKADSVTCFDNIQITAR